MRDLVEKLPSSIRSSAAVHAALKVIASWTPSCLVKRYGLGAGTGLGAEAEAGRGEASEFFKRIDRSISCSFVISCVICSWSAVSRSHGPMLPTWAMQQVGSFLGYTGRGANVVAKAAHGPLVPWSVRGEHGSYRATSCRKSVSVR